MKPMGSLLPWRRRRRRRRFCCWSGALLMGIAITVLACAGWARFYLWRNEALRAHHLGLVASLQALQPLYNQKQLLLQQDERQKENDRRRVARQQSVARWQGVLTVLANEMPKMSRLNRFALLEERLMIQGIAGDLSELSMLERSVKKLPGVRALETGTLKRESRDGISFHFRLALGGENHVSLP